MPGGSPKSPAMAGFLPAFPALLRKQLKGADYPAQKAILSAAVEGAQVDFDTASRIESRYLTNLVVNQGSKNMIQAFFFDLQAINAGKLRPQGIEPWKATKVGVLGAGMMGAGIAYVCARAGMEVVLKDVAVENAEKGKAYSEKLLDKAISRGRSTEEKKAELLGRIKATADPADLAGCDLVIEAVFEDPALKHQVFAEIAVARQPGRAALLQHLDAADHRARRPASTGPRTSSGCTSSRRSTRCRWSRSSRASRPPTRRWPRRTTSYSRSGRRRSSSTTAAASTPRG